MSLAGDVVLSLPQGCDDSLERRIPHAPIFAFSPAFATTLVGLISAIRGSRTVKRLSMLRHAIRLFEDRSVVPRRDRCAPQEAACLCATQCAVWSKRFRLGMGQIETQN